MMAIASILWARRFVCGTSLLLCAWTSAQAQQPTAGATDLGSVSGFATLALNHSDNATVGVISSLAQKRPTNQGWSGTLDSVVGLQYQWQPSPALGAMVQAVARADKDFRPELRMAYVRTQWAQALTLRMGRIRSPVFFDSDVDEIGYAYLMMRPPLTVYGPSKAVASLDGGDLQWRQSVGNASVVVQAHGGQSRYTQPLQGQAVFTGQQNADVRLRDAGGLALSIAMPDFTLRAARTWIGRYTFHAEAVTQANDGVAQIFAGLNTAAASPFLPPALASALQRKAQVVGGYANVFDGRVVYSSVGFDGNLGAWRLLGEWLDLDVTAPIVGRHQGQHLTLARSIGEFMPYVSYARQRRTTPRLNTDGLGPTGLSPLLDASLAQAKAGLDAVALRNDFSVKSISLGMRYDFRDHMALKVQFDRMKATGSEGSEGFFLAFRRPTDPVVNLFSVGLDLTF